jgi:hypothetical protein
MDGDDNGPPKGILFLLGDGTEWAEMKPRGVLGLDEPEPDEDLSPEFVAHFIPGNNRLH